MLPFRQPRRPPQGAWIKVRGSTRQHRAVQEDLERSGSMKTASRGHRSAFSGTQRPGLPHTGLDDRRPHARSGRLRRRRRVVFAGHRALSYIVAVPRTCAYDAGAGTAGPLRRGGGRDCHIRPAVGPFPTSTCAAMGNSRGWPVRRQPDFSASGSRPERFGNRLRAHRRSSSGRAADCSCS